MKRLTIFGNPVEHSISPNLHNKALQEFNIEGEYTKTHLEDGSKIKEIFLKNFDGANVTVPFKEIAYQLCDEVRGIAKEIGAVNTLVNEDGKMVGYNTDAPGFYKCIENLSLKSALILGAGGSSKAISFYLKEKNIDVTVVNRSEEKLEIFKEKSFKTYTHKTFQAIDEYDIVINTTSAGLTNNSLPMPEDLIERTLNKTKFVYDIIYNVETSLLKLADTLKINHSNGKDMLLNQAVLAFNIFFNNSLDEDKIEQSMKKTI